jgi:SAM-dependent methyltransferase
MAQCKLCSSSGIEYLFSKGTYKFLRCTECNLVFLECIPDEKDIYKLYKGDYLFNRNGSYGFLNYFSLEKAFQKTFRKRLNTIRKLKKSGSLLEIGAGAGFFLKEAQRFFQITGNEISKIACDYAENNLGIKINCGDFCGNDYKENSYDVVIMYDVIEHLRNPFNILKELSSIQNTNGLLVISTGDVDSIFCKLCGKRWHLFNPPEHLFFFSHKSIKLALKKAGYEIIKIEYPHNYYTLSYLLEKFTKSFYTSNKFCKTISNIKLFDKITVPLNLFDIMVVYAKKY